jgi:hypothetical protein
LASILHHVPRAEVAVMSNNPIRHRRRTHAIVPRSLLAYASVGLGMGAIPFSAGCGEVFGSPSIGVEPAMVEAGSSETGSSEAGTSDVSVGILPDVSVGIRPAMQCDAGSDVGTIGIRPAMEFDAGSDVSSIGIAPAMEFDSGSDVGSVGIAPAMDFDAGDQAADASKSEDAGVAP